MVLINDIWYDPKDLDDVSKIIRELFNEELADKMDALTLIDHRDYEDKLEIANDEIYDLNDYVSQLKEYVDELKEEIRLLYDDIKQLENK